MPTGAKKKNLSLKRSDQLRFPPSLLFNAYSRSLSGEKRPERVGQSTPSSVEVKNEWSYISTPLYAFMFWTGRASTWPFTAIHIISASFRTSQNAPSFISLPFDVTDAAEQAFAAHKLTTVFQQLIQRRKINKDKTFSDVRDIFITHLQEENNRTLGPKIELWERNSKRDHVQRGCIRHCQRCMLMRGLRYVPA